MLIFHVRKNSPIHIIHVCKEHLIRKSVRIWWNLKASPNLNFQKTIKNTWFIDSSLAQHRAHWTSPYNYIPLAHKYFFTDIHFNTNYHKKYFIFIGHQIFQEKALIGWPWDHELAMIFLCYIYSFYLITRFHYIFHIISEMSYILINHLNLTGYTLCIFASPGSTKNQIT